MEQRPEHPYVSVLVPARNEEANIGACVQSLLRQGAGVEVIVADDGSQDRTAEIVRELTAQAPHLKLVPVSTLPAGWVGKNHALHVAAQQARGDWLLFTDADTLHAEGKLHQMVERAERHQIDLLSLSPQQDMRSWWERAVIPLVFERLAQLYPYARVNDPADPLAAANGQYLLIRKEVYSQLGGHEAVRGEILEDVALAVRAKQAGFRIWFGSGRGVVRTRMYRRFAEMWQGWTKNLFLLYHRDRRAVRRAAAALALRYWLPQMAGAALLLMGFPAAGYGIALWVYAGREQLRYAARLRASGANASAALRVFPGAFLLFLLLLNSERRYSRNLGVEWKGRRYSPQFPDQQP
jgi:glycosyltransferase involved in cell wall biosynthesis